MKRAIAVLLFIITTFGNQATANLRKIPSKITRKALNKLDILNAVEKLDELQSPSGNRLEALKGNLKGFYSIRINNQWRITFQWQNDNVSQIQIIDYHD